MSIHLTFDVSLLKILDSFSKNSGGFDEIYFFTRCKLFFAPRGLAGVNVIYVAWEGHDRNLISIPAKL